MNIIILYTKVIYMCYISCIYTYMFNQFNCLKKKIILINEIYYFFIVQIINVVYFFNNSINNLNKD